MSIDDGFKKMLEGVKQADEGRDEVMAGLERAAMSGRLTPEREADIRLAVVHAGERGDRRDEPQRSLQWLLDEIDAVRADLATSEADYRAATVRVARAEVTLAAIRGWLDRWAPMQPFGASGELLALLDAAPKDTP